MEDELQMLLKQSYALAAPSAPSEAALSAFEVARLRKIGGINRQKGVAEDLEIARSYVERATGRDIAQALGHNTAVKLQ